MPKNKISDPITDQEMDFARLLLSGGMTDREAAEAVGLNPDSAAYIKSKPSIRDYLLQHRDAGQQQAGSSRHAVEGQHRPNLDREEVLNRLWELARLSPEMTRNSITGQVKVMAMIVAILDLIPNRRAGYAEKKPAPALPTAQVYKSEWLRKQMAATNDLQPTPAPPVRAQQEDAPAHSAGPGVAAESLPDPGPSHPAFAHRVPLADGVAPYVPQSTFVPDTRVPFRIKVNPFKHRR
jgi:hypothetical protein